MVSVSNYVLEDDAQEIILSSPYPRVSYDVATTSAVEYILRKVEENVQNGWIDWLTDSVTGETIRLSDLEPYSRRVASALMKRGMRHGEVAIYMTNDVTRIYAIIVGVWRVGGIMHAFDAGDNFDMLVDQIKHAKARWVFCDPESALQIKSVVGQLDCPVEILVFGHVDGTTPIDELFLDDGEDCPKKVASTGFTEPIIIISTSATTGTSKGVVYTNKSVLARCMMAYNAPKSSRQTMVPSRCVNVSGAFIPFSNAWMGSGLIMMSKITKENIFNCIKLYKPSVVIGFPWFFEKLPTDPVASQIDLSCIETFWAGGGIMTEKLYNAMLNLPNLKQVINMYTLSECGGVTSTVDRWNTGTVKNLESLPKLSVGRLNANTELKVVDIETGLTLGPMERGELIVRGPSIASGYSNLPEQTALTFVDGWVKTGDVGYFDNNGYIFIVNRMLDIFKVDGHYVYPSELEAKILEHPSVSQVCVFAVEDSKNGNKSPRALVVLTSAQSEITAEEIHEFAEGKLADHQRLRGGLYIVDSLPRSSMGKILKNKAAKLLI